MYPTIRDITIEISRLCDLEEDDMDLSNLDQEITGYVMRKHGNPNDGN